jgi:DNA-binding NtrC family response regulator
MNTSKTKILVVDDEPIKRSVLEDGLRDAGYFVVPAADPMEATQAFEENSFDVVITDIRMPGQDGLTFLGEIKRKRPEQAVIVMTAYGTVETAVKAMKLGAFDYVQKPFSTEEMLLKLDRLLRFEGLSRENEALRRALAPDADGTRLIGDCESIRRVLSVVHAVSGTDGDVLIEGESGTGKELVAKLIHETSHRAPRPFVAVSCAALSKDLIESELFGHEAGAFTGAGRKRLGRFELAHGGTLLLDDVDDIPIEAQVKLVRVLQERSFERVGGETAVTINTRVVAATKKSLATMMASGNFREDLYYRLSVVPIHLPPLRERRDDIPLLVEHFLERIAVKQNRGALGISTAVIGRLQEYHWPGNVRELEHLLERMATFARGDRIEETDVPDLPKPSDGPDLLGLSLDKVDRVDLAGTLAAAEARLIRWGIEKSRGNLAQAAKRLGLPRSSLQYKLGKLDRGDDLTSQEGN